MRTKTEIVARLKKNTSSKLIIIFHIGMFFGCSMLALSMTMLCLQCKKFMELSGITLSEVVNVDYHSNYSGYAVGAIYYYYRAFEMLRLLFYLSICWAVWPLKIKYDRQILTLIEATSPASKLDEGDAP